MVVPGSRASARPRPTGWDRGSLFQGAYRIDAKPARIQEIHDADSTRIDDFVRNARPLTPNEGMVPMELRIADDSNPAVEVKSWVTGSINKTPFYGDIDLIQQIRIKLPKAEAIEVLGQMIQQKVREWRMGESILMVEMRAGALTESQSFKPLPSCSWHFPRSFQMVREYIGLPVPCADVTDLSVLSRRYNRLETDEDRNLFRHDFRTIRWYPEEIVRGSKQVRICTDGKLYVQEWKLTDALRQVDRIKIDTIVLCAGSDEGTEGLSFEAEMILLAEYWDEAIAEYFPLSMTMALRSDVKGLCNEIRRVRERKQFLKAAKRVDSLHKMIDLGRASEGFTKDLLSNANAVLGNQVLGKFDHWIYGLDQLVSLARVGLTLTKAARTNATAKLMARNHWRSFMVYATHLNRRADRDEIQRLLDSHTDKAGWRVVLAVTLIYFRWPRGVDGAGIEGAVLRWLLDDPRHEELVTTAVADYLQNALGRFKFMEAIAGLEWFEKIHEAEMTNVVLHDQEWKVPFADTKNTVRFGITEYPDLPQCQEINWQIVD